MKFVRLTFQYPNTQGRDKITYVLRMHKTPYSLSTTKCVKTSVLPTAMQ